MAHKHEISDTLEVGRPNRHRAAPDSRTSTHIAKVLGGSRGDTHYENGFNMAATKASVISCGMSEHFWIGIQMTGEVACGALSAA
jgi:hypothetical protein